MGLIDARAACLAVSSVFVSAITVYAQQGDPFSQYEGVYAYHGGSTLALISTDTTLVAVIDEAKYPLRTLGSDRFLNGVGDTIPFRRGPDGTVSGFLEHGIFFARHTSLLDPAIRAIVHAVPRGSATYRYRVPDDTGDGLRTGDLADAGFHAADITGLVRRVVDGTYKDVHAILIYRKGKLVVEEYFYGYNRDRPHQMRSASKSVVSALAGIAIDRKLLPGDTDLVTKHLGYTGFANPDPRKNQLTFRDLLTMRSGVACNDWDQSSPGNESKMYQSADWVKFILDLPLTDPPGTRGSYCSGNVAVVGRAIERASGKSLPVFAQENLFAPLGIRESDFKWNYRLHASNASTVAQLYMRPRDMLKLGVLFHQKGQWNGRQVISREWIDRSTAKWSTVGDQDYGYFWWHQWVQAVLPVGPQRVDMVVATGNGGQKIYLVPTLDLVVVMTGGSYNANSPATTIMAKEILPAAWAAERPSGKPNE